MPFAPISSLIVQVIAFINVILIPLVMALAFLMFVWGVFKYFIAGGASEEARSEGQKFVMWSVIAFAVIFSIWGIVGLLVNSFGFGSPYRPPLPQFQPTQQGARGNGMPSGLGGGSDSAAGATVPLLYSGSTCRADRECMSGKCSTVTTVDASAGAYPGNEGDVTTTSKICD